jgi:hypothetical protein
MVKPLPPGGFFVIIQSDSLFPGGKMGAEFGLVNWLAVVAATVLAMVLGFVWYHPAVFGKAWMKELGKTQDQLGNPGPKYALMVVGSFVEATVLALVIKALGAPVLANSAVIGLELAIGFVATTFLGEAIFSGKSARLYLINVGYYTLALVLMGALLGAWR